MNSPLAYKPLDQITEADFQALVANKTIELKTLEYKGNLVGPRPSDHAEFIADVSSFANAIGGDLILGIPQRAGAPVSPVGLTVPNPDAEIRRMEHMVLNSIKPRIPNLVMRAVSVASGLSVIVVRMPRSWMRPHMVNGKFYSRTSNGRFQMDVFEVRSAVLMSETAAERIRSFRAERTALIVAGDAPVRLEEGPKVILHIVPAGGFEPGVGFDVTRLRPDHMGLLLPLATGFDGERFNLDGLLTSGRGINATAETYVQVFRSGALESVDGVMLRAGPGVTIIGGVYLEKNILEALPRYFAALGHLGVQPPAFVMLTLIGVAGRTIVQRRGIVGGLGGRPIDRDALFIPEVLVEDFAVKPDAAMKPAFDMLWNASGWPASPHYDNDGNWKLE